MNTENSSLFSINGTFTQAADNFPMDFQGFFSSPGNNEFIFGYLEDPLGPSHIHGIYRPRAGRFDFLKSYDGASGFIIYRFNKTTEDLWVGRYSMPGERGLISSKADCRITELAEEPEFIRDSLMSAYQDPRIHQKIGRPILGRYGIT